MISKPFFTFGLGLTIGTAGTYWLIKKESRTKVQPGQKDLLFEPNSLSEYGLPTPISTTIQRQAYGKISLILAVNYNQATRNPNWAIEHLTRTTSEIVLDRKKAKFMEDKTIETIFRTRMSDYHHSGYDRGEHLNNTGHLVPAADIKASQEALNETFYLSNMSPQYKFTDQITCIQ